MPGRMAARRVRAEGPRPFSSEWLASDVPPEPAAPSVRIPTWLPNRRTLSTAMLVIITLGAAVVPIIDGNRAVFITPTSSQSENAPAFASEPSSEAPANTNSDTDELAAAGVLRLHRL